MKLFDYQSEAIERISTQDRLIMVSPTGSGKSVMAIRALEGTVGNVLIVCPAVVREVWKEQLAEWSPGTPYYVWKKPTPLKRDRPNDARVWITSYELLGKIPIRFYSLMIFDEVHYLAHEGSNRTRAVKLLVGQQRDAKVLGLSATPITNRADSLWAQLDAIWPGKMPNYYAFVRTYMDVGANDYSNFVIKGLKDGAAEKLRNTLSGLCHFVDPDRVSRAFGNRFSITVHPMRADYSGNMAELFTRLDGKRSYAAAAFAKSDGRSPKILLCRYRKTAQEVRDYLGSAVLINGDLAPEARMAAIQGALDSGTDCVATYQSVLEGINILSKFSCAIYVEIPYTPGQALQSLGRFNRASGQCPVTILVYEGTPEEEYARRLKDKLIDAQSLVGTTQTGTMLQKSLDFDGDKALKELSERLQQYEPDESGY
jgi:superfamily II DNA or RNA helicase